MASCSVLEPIVFLYRRTGDVRYLEFAKYIVGQWETATGPKLISKAMEGIPVGDRFPHPSSMNETWFGTKNGQKAYEMMSCYEGLLEIYKLTNDSLYLNAVEKTVRSIADTEINIADREVRLNVGIREKSSNNSDLSYNGNLCDNDVVETMPDVVEIDWKSVLCRPNGNYGL